MTIYILFFIAIVIFLYLWFKGKNLDSNDNWASKLNENKEKNIIRDEFNAARNSNNALLWWLTWYTIANLFNKDENKDNEIDEDKNEENTWNDEQWAENDNSDFEQDFDDFDSSFDSSFDDGWDDWWFDD